MAKWGEGDPRWIVEERPDATNVNNWHWTEKNASIWSQEKIKELFANFKIAGDGISCTLLGVEKCNGEAVANNRKGKLIFFYEWDIVLKWMSTNNNMDGKIEGNINIPNLSEENDISEVDIEITLKDSTDDGEKVKHFLHTKGKNAIREKLAEYVSCLKKEFTVGMLLPKKYSATESNASLPSSTNDKIQVNTSRTPSNNNDIDSNQHHDNNTSVPATVTTTIKQQQKFQCRAQDFYRALTTIEMVEAFTKGPVKMDVKNGGKFELFGGNIQGEFAEIQPTKIVQKWRCKLWPDGHYSQVTIDICERNDHTEVNFMQTGVPISEEEATKVNWERYYWEAMKRTFGFGYFM